MLTFYSRILVAYDGSKLSEKALNMAITLAKQDNQIELNVVAVSNSPIVSTVGTYGIYNQELIDDLKDHTEKMINGVKEKLASSSNKYTTIVLEGNPGKIIVDYANKNNCDLIVMGSRGLSGLVELFLGSTSHYVVQRAHCPVFIVK